MLIGFVPIARGNRITVVQYRSSRRIQLGTIRRTPAGPIFKAKAALSTAALGVVAARMSGMK